MENTQVQESKPKWKKIVSIVLNVLFYCFILFLFIFAISNIAGKDKHYLPNLFGYGYCNIPTQSMESDREDALFVGDMVFVKVVNKKEQLENLKVNEDVIVFYDNTYNIFIIHRLVDIIDAGSGKKTYITQGDAVAELDPYNHEKTLEYFLSNNRVEKVSEDDVIAIYTGNKWNGFGKVLSFLQSQLGFGLCIVLPTALLLLYEGFILVKNLMELNRQKLAKQMEASNQQTQEEKEAERARLRQELMEEMKKEQEEKEKQEKENKPDKPE